MNANEIIEKSEYQDEKIILMIRKHPWYFTKVIIAIIIIFIILLISYHFYKFSKITIYISSAGLIFIILYFFYEYFRWKKTYYFITNHRLISFEQKGFFSYNMQEVILENVLFLSHEVSGIINTLLNKGSVHIRASGVIEDELVFETIASPYEVEQKISEVQKKFFGIEPQTKEETNKKPKKEKTIIR